MFRLAEDWRLERKEKRGFKKRLDQCQSSIFMLMGTNTLLKKENKRILDKMKQLNKIDEESSKDTLLSNQ